MQKLNRVLSSVMQLHPTTVDFWLIAVYAELDIKGNLFSSRNLMLQGIRNNSESPLFYIEYFKFELAFMTKIKQRKEILQNRGAQDITFVDEQNDEEPINEPGKMDDSDKILRIVL